MKLTIKGQEYPVVRVGDWTFDEADAVQMFTSKAGLPGLTPGQVLGQLMRGEPRADKAFAIVAYLRAGKDPADLGQLKLDDVEFDPSDDEEAAEESPPAGGGDGVKETDAA